MARSGSLPSALARVNPTRRTPDNAIHLMVGLQFVSGLSCAIFGAETVFPAWALSLTLGLIVMYVLASVGVIRYYTTEKRDEYNPLLHLVFPVLSTVAVLFVGYKSIVPLPQAPDRYALVIFTVYTVLGACLLAYFKWRGREEWLDRAGLAMETSD
jgi:amino acid transporter